MGGTSEKTTSSRSDTMKGLYTAINKAKFRPGNYTVVKKFPVWDWEPSVQTNTVQMRSQKQYMVR